MLNRIPWAEFRIPKPRIPDYLARGNTWALNPLSPKIHKQILETDLHTLPLRFKSDGQEKSTKILISWEELKNQFLSFFVHR